jgi:lipopolysaccharide assembly outer membrane protein LptD (OstA)
MQVRLFAVLSAGLLGMYGVSAADSAFNYVETPATVVESRVSCIIANSKRRHVDEVTGKLAEIDCNLAPMVAASLGYQPEDVQQRVRFTYQYVSPADASLQLFQAHAETGLDRYSPGTRLLISAHSSEPRSHRFD